MAERPDMVERGMPDLVAPRRVFRRKRNKGLILALKISLPLIAVSCVGYIYYWWLRAPVVRPVEVLEKNQAPSQNGSDVTLQKVQYNGVDANNRPFSITADSASQPQKQEPAPAPASADPDLAGENAQAPQPPASSATTDSDTIVNLKKLIADMTMEDGAWVALTADEGIYHRDAGTVDLSGNVTLFHDTGLSFETDAATVDLRNDWARGDQPVEGQNPDGQLAAEGFEVRDNGQTIVFTGRAYLKLFPKNGGGS